MNESAEKIEQEQNVLYVKAFSGFSVKYRETELIGGKQVESQFSLLLQLLLHNRSSGVPRSLIKATLFEDREIEDVSHAIRTVVYNAKKRLSAFGLPACDYIQQRKGVYYWTDEIAVVEDAEEFERSLAEARLEEVPEERVEGLLDVCYRYSGRFLSGLDSVVWAFQESERYRDLFHGCVEEAAALLRQAHRYKTMYDLGVYASTADPFAEWEELTMEALVGLGRFEEAERFYDDTVNAYIKEYGNRSNEYVKDITKKLGNHLIYQHETIEEIQSKLRNMDPYGGRGYFCSLPVFQELYRTMERTMERSGERVYLMLCTIVDSKGNPMKEGPRLEGLSERLQDAIVESVRHTDTVTRYGKGQYLILLINTSKENCAIIERRISSNFLIGRQRTGVEYSVNSVIFPNN
ncbi:MAG: hypothetical protein IJ751_04300 [Oscillospiraceae bacterium]|nr:hypothetical protein [Oscillospiraceae bacterium]